MAAFAPTVSCLCVVAFAPLMLGALAVAGCVSSENPTTPTVDGGSVADATTRGDAAVAETDGSAPSGDAGNGNTADAAPGARDPYRQQWPVSSEQPAPATYVVDADAGLVADTMTGLVWTRAVLQQEQTAFDAGSGAGALTENDHAGARAACAAATVGGVSGFRLPTMIELMTIIDFDKNDWNDPRSFKDTAYGDVYWADQDEGVAITYDNHYPPWHFISSPFAPKGPWASAAIRCVKASYPVTDRAQPVPAGRFIVHGTTAVDTVTQLEWQIGMSPVITYFAATSYCAGLASSDAGVDAGGNPWRIPNLKEMASLWSEKDGGPEPSVFGAVQGSGNLWTSSLYWGNSIGQGPNLRFTWYPAGDTGPKFFSWDANQSFSNTRCVRSVGP